MASTRQFTLPDETFRLEEIHMPEELAAALAGQSVVVKVLPEVPSRTLRIDLDNPPVGVSVLVDDDGTAWNDDWPARVIYGDLEGHEWRLPRHWHSDGVSPVIEASRYEVTQESRWRELWVPPTPWDLGDINIHDVPGDDGGADRARPRAPGVPARHRRARRPLGEPPREAHERPGDLLGVGVASVRFAAPPRPHFEVISRPELSRPAAPDAVQTAWQAEAHDARWSALWLRAALAVAYAHAGSPAQAEHELAAALEAGERYPLFGTLVRRLAAEAAGLGERLAEKSPTAGVTEKERKRMEAEARQKRSQGEGPIKKEIAKLEKGAPIDWPGFGTFTVFISSLLLALTLAAYGVGEDRIVIGLTIAMVVSLVAFVYIELHAKYPLLDLKLLQVREFSGGVVAQLLNAVSFGAVLLLLSVYLQQIQGNTALITGLIMIPLDITTVLVGPLSGKLSDKYGHLPFTTGGLLIVSASLFLFATTDVNTPLLLLIVYMMIFGTGMGIFASPNMSSIMGAVPSERRGIASAFRATFFNVGFVISLNLAILIMTFTINFNDVSQIIAAANPLGISLAEKVAFAASLRNAYLWMAVINTIAIVPSMLRGRRSAGSGALSTQEVASLEM